jgi:hypothetical protein
MTVDTFDLVIAPLDELLVEQLRYYSDRAPEYDEAYERRGRHDHGPDANRRWRADLEQAAAALEGLPIDGPGFHNTPSSRTCVPDQAPIGRCGHSFTIQRVPP